MSELRETAPAISFAIGLGEHFEKIEVDYEALEAQAPAYTFLERIDIVVDPKLTLKNIEWVENENGSYFEPVINSKLSWQIEDEPIIVIAVHSIDSKTEEPTDPVIIDGVEVTQGTRKFKGDPMINSMILNAFKKTDMSSHVDNSLDRHFEDIKKDTRIGPIPVFDKRTIVAIGELVLLATAGNLLDMKYIDSPAFNLATFTTFVTFLCKYMQTYRSATQAQEQVSQKIADKINAPYAPIVSFTPKAVE